MRSSWKLLGEEEIVFYVSAASGKWAVLQWKTTLLEIHEYYKLNMVVVKKKEGHKFGQLEKGRGIWEEMRQVWLLSNYKYEILKDLIKSKERKYEIKKK